MSRILLAGGLMVEVFSKAIAATPGDGVDATATAWLIALGCLPTAYRLADDLRRGLITPSV